MRAQVGSLVVLSCQRRLHRQPRASETATLDALLALLYRIAGKEWQGRAIEETFAEFDSGSALLEKHTVESLGEAPADRNVRIMVTMPSEAANDPNLVRDFLNRGMNIMRINCAHDSAEEWLRMVENLHAAQKATGKPCKIAFDLAGPKLRTGPVSPSRGFAANSAYGNGPASCCRNGRPG